MVILFASQLASAAGHLAPSRDGSINPTNSPIRPGSNFLHCGRPQLPASCPNPSTAYPSLHDNFATKSSSQPKCRTVSSRLLVMALWPTCPARGLPDTEERSSRKLPPDVRVHSPALDGLLFFLSSSGVRPDADHDGLPQLPQGRPQEACPPDGHHGLQGWYDHHCPRPRPTWREVPQEGSC